MKNIKFILTILLFATACSDILEEDPKAVANETFYKNTEEVESALYAAYAGIRIVAAGCYTTVANFTNDLVDYAKGRGSHENCSKFQGYNATDISRITSMWALFYVAIRNANLVIKNAPNSSAPQDKIKQFIAEAKFLRALDYFYMVRAWAGVPLRTEDNMLDSDIPRSSIDEVYALILSDLEYAEANLPESQTLVGRANKYAAKTLMSHVYLQLGRWSDSRAKALEVINSGNYSLVEVSNSDDFYKIFGPGIVTTSEEIFYLKYTSLAPSYIAVSRAHPSVSYFNYMGSYALYADSVDVKMISDWDYKDLRKKFMLYNVNIGFSSRTMLFKKFIDPTAPNIDAGSNDYPVYRYPDILLIYAEADCRANNGPTADGMEKLNMIHRRAYGKDSNATSSVDFKITDYTKDSFIDLVLKEGCYEQMDEGKRFFELKRAGKLKEAVMYSRGIDVVEKHFLWPIPRTEYEYNKAIDPIKDQNPGY